MDTMLVGITALSLLMALGMGAILFRAIREERQRSDARVEALVAAARRVETSRAPRDSAAAPGPPAEAPMAVPHELFADRTASPVWWRRASIALLAAGVLGSAGYLLVARHTARTGPERSGDARAVQLELLALRHVQEPDGLSILGVVQNSSSGAPVSGAVATASVFGPDGAFLASGRAELDAPTLAPGDESSFVVKIPVTEGIARYRIGFRGPDGSVLAHVDKRSHLTSARGVTAGSTP